MHTLQIGNTRQQGFIHGGTSVFECKISFICFFFVGKLALCDPVNQSYGSELTINVLLLRIMSNFWDE